MYYSLRYIREDRPAFFNAILTNDGTIGGAVGAAKPHETFCFLTGCFIFLSKKRIEDNRDHNQHNKNKNEAHDNLVRHHANQICANQLKH